MAPKKSKDQEKRLQSRQDKFVKAYPNGKTLGDAAIEAGYSAKNPHQSGYQALKQIKGRIPEVMNELGLTDRLLIQKYLIPLLEAKETKFFKKGKRRINFPALGIRHTALDTAFKLRGSYVRRDPKEAEQFGNMVVVVDIPRPPRNAIDVTPRGGGGNGTPPQTTTATTEDIYPSLPDSGGAERYIFF
jgi:hypothetical protein